MVIANSSGQGKTSIIPPQIKRWNWGAFWLTWIWGIANNVSIAWLMFIPGVNLAVWILLGARGNQWAWQNKRWNSVDDFLRTQRIWGVVGLVVWVVMLSICTLIMVFIYFVGNLITHSEPVETAMQRLNSNTEITRVLGEPLTLGFPQGSVKTQNDKGCAQVAIAVKGSQKSGTLHIDAVKQNGRWFFQNLEIEIDGIPFNLADPEIAIDRDKNMDCSTSY